MSYQKQHNHLLESAPKKIGRSILEIFIFPYRVSQKYKKYHAGLNEMIDSFNDKYAYTILKRNIKLINLLIRLPFAIGFIISVLLIYKNPTGIKNELVKLPKMYKVQIFKKGITKPDISFKKNQAIKIDSSIYSLIPLLLGYIIQVGGSLFLSFNPAFEEQKKIQKSLLLHRCINEDGSPWEISWTPYGILFFGYNCDPESLRGNERLWSTINFKPDEVRVSEHDASIFLYKRKYELPSKLPLVLSDLLKEKLKNKVEIKKVEAARADVVEELASGDSEKATEELTVEATNDKADNAPTNTVVEVNKPVEVITSKPMVILDSSLKSQVKSPIIHNDSKLKREIIKRMLNDIPKNLTLSQPNIKIMSRKDAKKNKENNKK